MSPLSDELRPWVIDDIAAAKESPGWVIVLCTEVIGTDYSFDTLAGPGPYQIRQMGDRTLRLICKESKDWAHIGDA